MNMQKYEKDQANCKIQMQSDRSNKEIDTC